MLQTLGNKVPFSFTKILLADIARLDKRHKLAKMIEEYEEQPDPMAQKMAELEVAMKEAQVRNETAKGAENEVDVQLKSWKAEYEKARARNLEADSDMKDLDFVRKGQGIEHQEQMDKELLKEENKANIAVLNSMNANNDRRTNE
jgi:CHASE3 domain sensor protein